MEEIYQIYDKAFKRILTLSDSILTINNKDIYHIEAQMTEDEEIVSRVFEYGFGHAYKNRAFQNGRETMIFPRPCIVYLDEGKKDKIPDEYTLVLKFEDQGDFSYKVPVLKLQSISAKELNEKKLIALFPFLLLKLRKKMEKIRSKENMEALQKLVADDIINSIRNNEEVGDISHTDALDLIELTTKLYMRIYSKYKEMEEFTMRLYDQSMELASDKYEKTVEELEEIIVEKDDNLRIKDELIRKQEKTITSLKRQLERMQKA